MTLLERMDWFAHVTRLDRLAFLDWQPRSLRWIPVLPIAGLVASLVLIVQAEGHPGSIRQLFAAILLFTAFYLATVIVRLFGPRFHYAARHPLDERELAIKARASGISGTIVTIGVIVGCFYMALASFVGGWRPTALDWVYLGLGVQGTAFALPTLIASWLMPRPGAEED